MVLNEVIRAKLVHANDQRGWNRARTEKKEKEVIENFLKLH